MFPHVSHPPKRVMPHPLHPSSCARHRLNQAPSHAAAHVAWRVSCGAGRRGVLPAVCCPNPIDLVNMTIEHGGFHAKHGGFMGLNRQKWWVYGIKSMKKRWPVVDFHQENWWFNGIGQLEYGISWWSNGIWRICSSNIRYETAEICGSTQFSDKPTNYFVGEISINPDDIPLSSHYTKVRVAVIDTMTKSSSLMRLSQYDMYMIYLRCLNPCLLLKSRK